MEESEISKDVEKRGEIETRKMKRLPQSPCERCEVRTSCKQGKGCDAWKDWFRIVWKDTIGQFKGGNVR